MMAVEHNAFFVELLYYLLNTTIKYDFMAHPTTRAMYVCMSEVVN